MRPGSGGDTRRATSAAAGGADPVSPGRPDRAQSRIRATARPVRPLIVVRQARSAAGVSRGRGSSVRTESRARSRWARSEPRRRASASRPGLGVRWVHFSRPGPGPIETGRFSPPGDPWPARDRSILGEAGAFRPAIWAELRARCGGPSLTSAHTRCQRTFRRAQPRLQHVRADTHRPLRTDRSRQGCRSSGAAPGQARLRARVAVRVPNRCLPERGAPDAAAGRAGR